MKRVEYNSLLLVGVLVFSITTGCATRTGPLPSWVIDLNGEARSSVGGQSWNRLPNDDPVKPGGVVQTAANSTLDIRLGYPLPGVVQRVTELPRPRTNRGDLEQACLIRLHPDTILGIDEVTGKTSWHGNMTITKVRLDLRSGALTMVAPAAATPVEYEIIFTKGIVQFESASFRLTDSGKLHVQEGKVVVSIPARDWSRMLEAGQLFDPLTGEVIQPQMNGFGRSILPLEDNHSDESTF